MSEADHPLRAAQDRTVAAEHDQQLHGRAMVLDAWFVQLGDVRSRHAGQSSASSSGGMATSIPAATRPSTRRVAAATAAGRPKWVRTPTRRNGAWPVGTLTCHSIGASLDRRPQPYGGARRRAARRRSPAGQLP